MTITMSNLTMTFAEFMEKALYGPDGYYASGRAASGKKGDYFTAPDVGSLFGKLLAALFMDWRRKFKARPFHLVEIGAGEGALAASIADAFENQLPAHFDEVRYSAVEMSEARQERLASRSDAFLDKGILFHVLPSLEPIEAFPVTGLFFANELIDALPVHRVRMKGGKLQEAFVTDEDPPTLLWKHPSTPDLQRYFGRLNIHLPDGYETEVNVAQKRWLTQVSRCLTEGLVLLIDYGRPAQDYYAPERNKGTLRAFRHHRVSSDVLKNPGQSDLTADVDFTSLALDAQEVGFVPLAFMSLGSFLVPAVQRLLASGAAIPPVATQHLIHPEAMGDAFHVLLMGKDVRPEDWVFEHNRLGRLQLPAKGVRHVKDRR